MDSDRPHHRTAINPTTTTSSNSNTELFICFTSRLSSSSSMKISSKSILSPNRTGRDHPTSLSKSLSRSRLRTSASIRGAHGLSSPMFPTGANKKRGCGFENPEPSSPKVTCIGQVRVKSKKKGKKIRTLSRRRCAGEVSFRNVELSREGSIHYQQSEQRNQRWVHLPLTICEALKTFGAEFSCLFPCRPSSCFSASEREKEDKSGQSYCGSVFARWLVDVGKGGEMELVQRRRSFSSVREIEDGEKWKVKDVVEEEEGRVSICVPPKNALLLMRCRSDPLKLSALANRMWESPVPVEEEDEDEEEIGIDVEEDIPIDCDNGEVDKPIDCDDSEVGKQIDYCDVEEGNQIDCCGVAEDKSIDSDVGEDIQIDYYDVEEVEEVKDGSSLEDEGCEECSIPGGDFDEEVKNQETEMAIVMEVQETENDNPEEELEFCKEESESEIDNPEEVVLCKEEESEIDHPEEELEFCKEEAESENGNPEEELEFCKKEESETEERLEHEMEELESEFDGFCLRSLFDEEEGKGGLALELEETEKSTMEDSIDAQLTEEGENTELSDCLLMMMMCEPKLSMEVSKETWVCSTDFINQVITTDGPDEEEAKKIITVPAQRRSSCSFPAPVVSMTTMIEQRLVNCVAYEPFVLTRCKSAPVRTAAKLVPEASCCWNDGKLEPHRRATFGVGAAGVGF